MLLLLSIMAIIVTDIFFCLLPLIAIYYQQTMAAALFP